MSADFKPVLKDYKNLPPFKGMVIQQFPFIEEDFDAITNYQLLCKVVEYLKSIYNNEILLEENMTNLYNAYVNLENYVNEFFSDLNLQDEVNNWLDNAIESGELENILYDYTNVTRVFNTCVEMKSAEGLLANQKVKTLGYYEINDGGGADYYITDEETVTDFQEELENGKYASLVTQNNTINIRQLGARSQDSENNKYDIKNYLDIYSNLLSKNTNKLKLYIPSGIWYTSPFNIERLRGFDIFGDFGFNGNAEGSGTILTSTENNQNYIIKIGGTNNFTNDFSLRNICFSTSDYLYDVNGYYKRSTIKTIAEKCLYIINSQFGELDNIFFMGINGRAFGMCSSWEIYFKLLNFRGVNAISSSVVNFETVNTDLTVNANITACLFEKVMFEGVTGHLFNFEPQCGFTNNSFGTINFEDYTITREGITYTTFTDENISDFEESNPSHFYMFNVKGDCVCNINNIDLNNFSFRYLTYNNQNYAYDSISHLDTNRRLSVNINNINVVGMRKDAFLLHTEGGTVDAYSSFCLNNLITNSGKNFKFDIDRFKYIKCDCLLTGRSGNRFVYNLENSLIPFYKNVVTSNNTTALLKSDSDSINNIKVCVSMTGTSAIACLLCDGKEKLIIRAKIPNGETASCAINGDFYKTFVMAGDGNFKNYEIDISSTTGKDYGKKCYISFTGDNTATSCILDCYKFI